MSRKIGKPTAKKIPKRTEESSDDSLSSSDSESLVVAAEEKINKKLNEEELEKIFYSDSEKYLFVTSIKIGEKMEDIKVVSVEDIPVVCKMFCDKHKLTENVYSMLLQNLYNIAEKIYEEEEKLEKEKNDKNDLNLNKKDEDFEEDESSSDSEENNENNFNANITSNNTLDDEKKKDKEENVLLDEYINNSKNTNIPCFPNINSPSLNKSIKSNSSNSSLFKRLYEDAARLHQNKVNIRKSYEEKQNEVLSVFFFYYIFQNF
jgi:hypothetical protein